MALKPSRPRGPSGAQVWYAAVLLGGIALTVVGAELSVRGAVAIAQALGVSATLIGLTIVAIGTSAPELVTTIISTIKNELVKRRTFTTRDLARLAA